MSNNSKLQKCKETIASLESEAIYFKKNPSTMKGIKEHLEWNQTIIQWRRNDVKEIMLEIEKEAHQMNQLKDLRKTIKDCEKQDKILARKRKVFQKETERMQVQCQKEWNEYAEKRAIEKSEEMEVVN